MSQMPPEQTPQPTVPAPPRGPTWTNWWQTFMQWMERSQQITARWLYELGGWIFGGLIVAALMILQDLISLGSLDRATVVAGLAIAIALPFNVTGLVIVRYFRDLNQAVEEARLALAQNVNAGAEEQPGPAFASQAFSPAKRRTMDMAVSAALFLSVLFTLIGIAAALWRISWAVTILFIIAALLGLLLILRVVRYSG
jgi:hypothetical protein